MKKILILTVLGLLLFGCSFSQVGADLTISNMTFNEVSKELNIKVLNEGRENSKSFFVEAYEGENFLGRTEVVGIGRGGQFTATISGVSLSNGSHTIQATVDPENNIRESNEKNNEFEITIVIGEDTTPPGEEEIDLQKLVQKGINQENVHYKNTFSTESFSSDYTMTGTGEVWQKNGFIKLVSNYDEFLGQPNVSLIVIEKDGIAYMKDEDPEREFDWVAYSTSGSTSTFTAYHYLNMLKELEEAIGDKTLEVEIIGRERIGTSDTLVVEFSRKPMMAGMPSRATVKVWLSIDSGIPLKTEILNEQSKQKEQVTEIDFEEIDESVFEIVGTVDYKYTKALDYFQADVYTYNEEIVNDEGYQTQVRLEGALVEVTKVGSTDSWQCTTGIDGKCKIENFKAGEYNIKATKEGCEDRIKENYETDTSYVYYPILLNCEDSI